MRQSKSDLPPLVILNRPDGSPDWDAVNALARGTILDVLGTELALSGEALARTCHQRGVHPKVTHRARCRLEEEGLIEARRQPRHDGGCEARVWSRTRAREAEGV